MNQPLGQDGVFVLSRDADAYVRLLADEGIVAAAATDAAAVAARYAGEPVVLGDPGLLVQALDDMDGVRWVQSTWAGVAPLLDAASAGLTVTGIKGVFGPQMAEYVLGYLLAHELGVIQRFQWQAEQRWVTTPTGRIAGKTMGILGMGSIGRVVAGRAQALGLRVLGCSRSGAATAPFTRVFAVEDLHAFLGECDYLVTLLPDTPDTAGLLDADALAALPAGAVLVNAGRGSVIDEQALVAALGDGHMGGAVLDVFNQEPLPQDHPFWTTPNLRVTAHVAALSEPADIVAVFLDNFRRFQAGKPLQYTVDARRGY